MSTIFTHEDTRPHVNLNQCGKCRAMFKQGDRVMQAHIFEKQGINPQAITEIGVMLYKEYELVHIDCRDPLLKKGLMDRG